MAAWLGNCVIWDRIHIPDPSIHLQDFSGSLIVIPQFRIVWVSRPLFADGSITFLPTCLVCFKMPELVPT